MLKWITRILIGLAIVLVLVRAADWGVRRSSKLPAVSQPNGYPRLVELGARFQKPQADLAELNRGEIIALGRTNAAVARELHGLLNGPVQVPLSTRNDWVNQHQEELKNLKKLAVMLAVQGRAHLLEGRTNDALECELDLVRLGQSITRGGVLVDGLTGLTLELIGVSGLRAHAGRLPAAACRHAARVLAGSENNRAGADAIIKTQAAWSDATFGLISRVGTLVMRSSPAERYKDFHSRHEDAVRRTRRLTLLLAARAMELETGRPPKQPADLVPEYIKAVPADPGTGKPIRDVPSLAN